MKHYTHITDKFARPISFSFENTNVTAHAGAPLLHNLITESPIFKETLPYLEALTGRTANPLNFYSDYDLFSQLLLMIGLDRTKLSEANCINQDPLIDDISKKVASPATCSRYLSRVNEACQKLRENQGCPQLTEQLPKHDPKRIGCKFFDCLNEKLLDCNLDVLYQKYQQNLLFSAVALKPLIIVDADSTFLEVYGNQQESAYCGKNRANGYFPLIVYMNGMPVHIQNAPGATDGRRLLEHCLGNILYRIRRRFPTAIILLRADAGFNSSRIIQICDQHQSCYIIGYTQNGVLIDHVCKQLLEQITGGQCTDGLFRLLPNDIINCLNKDWTLSPELDPKNAVERFCGVVGNYQAGSWQTRRRLFYRIQYSRQHRETDFRFIQTNLDDESLLKFSGRRGQIKGLTDAQNHFDSATACQLAIEAYDGLYCDRAHCELNIREFKQIKSGVDLSCHGFFANWFKLMLVAILQHILRRYLILSERNLTNALNKSIITLRKWVFNCPAKVRFYKRRVEVVLTEPRYGFNKLWLSLLRFTP